MRWIHFSDIHFNMNGYDTEKMRERLLIYLNKLQKRQIDAMFITGDFRYAPQKNFLDDTKLFIDKIRCQCGIENRPIYCTPGNHDVDRNRGRLGLIKQVKESYKSYQGDIELESWKMLYNGVETFNNFIGDSAGEIVGKDNPHRFIENEHINIICMNTTVISGENSECEYGQLVVGIRFLEECFKKIDRGKPTIVYGHHSIESLKYEERVRVIELFQSYNVHIYLCGHNHVFEINNISNDEKYRIYEVFSGNLYTEERWSQCGFLVAELVDDVLKIECHEWDFNNRKWHVSNTYSDDEERTYRTLMLEPKIHINHKENYTEKNSELQNVMQFNGNNCAISVPEYERKFYKNKWPVIHKLEYEYTLRLINAIGIPKLNIETDYKVTYPYSEIRIGGPTVNNNTYRYIGNHIKSYRAILKSENVPKPRMVDKDFIIYSDNTGFSIENQNGKRVNYCRTEYKNDIGVLIRLKINDKKTVHLIFGVGKRGTMVAINYLINYAEDIYRQCGNKNYFLCVWGNYSDYSIDTSKEPVDLSYLVR